MVETRHLEICPDAALSSCGLAIVGPFANDRDRRRLMQVSYHLGYGAQRGVVGDFQRICDISGAAPPRRVRRAGGKPRITSNQLVPASPRFLPGSGHGQIGHGHGHAHGSEPVGVAVGVAVALFRGAERARRRGLGGQGAVA